MLCEMPGDGIYGKHRDYRRVLDWSGKPWKDQKRMIEALNGVMSVLLDEFHRYHPVELEWLEEMVNPEDMVFKFSTTLIKITSQGGDVVRDFTRHTQM